MSANDMNSASNTGTTSTSAPGTAEAAGAGSAGGASEAEFIARQMAEAKAAMRHVVENLKSELAKGVDVRLWTREHPGYAVAGAGVAGFATAAAAVPTKEDQALKRLAALERAVAPPRKESENGDHHQAPKSGFLSSVGRELVGALKPLLMSALTAGATAAAAGQQQEPGEAEEYS
jgi:hypothetical protein